MKTQINITLPKIWKTELERLARVFSVKEDKTISYQDLIRRSVKKIYKLKDIENE